MARAEKLGSYLLVRDCNDQNVNRASSIGTIRVVSNNMLEMEEELLRPCAKTTGSYLASSFWNNLRLYWSTTNR